MSSSTCAAKPADNESKTVEITAFANLGHESERYEACSDAEEHRRHMVEIQRSAGQETSKAAEADRMPCSSSNCPICQIL